MSDTTSVFVGNLPYDVREEQMIELFRPCGEILRFRLLLDEFGKGKGYGFCDFATVEGAEAAKKLNNIISFNGRHLRVDSAALGNYGGAGKKSSGGESKVSRVAFTVGDRQARELEEALKQFTYGEVSGLGYHEGLWTHIL